MNTKSSNRTTSEAQVDEGMVDVMLESGGDANSTRNAAVDSFTEVEYSSWGERMKSSCGGICIGRSHGGHRARGGDGVHGGGGNGN